MQTHLHLRYACHYLTSIYKVQGGIPQVSAQYSLMYVINHI